MATIPMFTYAVTAYMSSPRSHSRRRGFMAGGSIVVRFWVGYSSASTGDHMSDKPMFTTFWTNESKTTAKVLGRIPEGSDYRPDPKSRTAQQIAWAIVCEEKMIIDALESGKVEWAPPPMPATMKEVVDTYEKQSTEIVVRWQALPDARWNGQLDFFGTERPASPMAWSFLFDIVHHRGQISTYLRPMGSTVPQIYGPSGDEP